MPREEVRSAIEDNGANCGQPVEERSVADGLPSTRMADDQDPVQVHLAVQRMGGRVVPGPKLFQVLEMNDGPSVVLAEIEPVEKVDINRRRDEPMRQFIPATGPTVVPDSYYIIHGSQDADVSTFEGYHTYERAHAVDLANPTVSDGKFNAMLWVHKANHTTSSTAFGRRSPHRVWQWRG